jgi:hypothetical protein
VPQLPLSLPQLLLSCRNFPCHCRSFSCRAAALFCHSAAQRRNLHFVLHKREKRDQRFCRGAVKISFRELVFDCFYTLCEYDFAAATGQRQ